ncbi:MAG: hypothetical protein ACI3ZZ_01935 [Candidatus Aphodosoma sp.]
MTPQEILASLSRLESELNEVASARLLVEQTVNSYKEVQKELCSFVGKFKTVTDSLNTVASAFQDGNESLATEVTHLIEILKAQLETINNSFSSQCNSVISRFIDSANKTSNQLKTKTVELTSVYAANNDAFKKSIKELANIHVSLLKASESITALKTDVSTLESQLQSSQNAQDKILEKITKDLQASTASHTTILQQISNDLRTSQHAQDEALATLKQNISAIASNQAEHASKTEQAISDIAKVEIVVSRLDSTFASQVNDIQSKLNSLTSAVSSVRTIEIVNIVAIIIAIIVLIVK